MVTGTTTTERVSKVEAKRLWSATVKDNHNFLPKIWPEIFSSVTFLEGDEGAGTIKQFNFTPAATKEFSYVKERVDEIDEEKLVYKYAVIEGGPLGNNLIALSYEIKFVAREDGGCLITRTSNYETLPGAQFDEGKVKELKEKMNAMFEKVEQYLLSNPNLY
uniref:Bet v I/Major latex protein domain-containing protein n=1 Tax=Picea sitchensis TaxID=3332 RepID=A9NYJ4_PICSI|nr:unknown [Picea sitchensis]